MKASVCFSTSTGLYKDIYRSVFCWSGDHLHVSASIQGSSSHFSPPLLSPVFLFHPSSSHFPGAAAAAASSVPSVWRSVDMVDAPSAMNKGPSVPEIKPLDQYDFNRAKICASVRWLLSKSYGSAGTTVRGAVWVGRLIINALHTEIEAVLCHVQGIFQYLNARHLALVMLVPNLLYPILCTQL